MYLRAWGTHEAVEQQAALQSVTIPSSLSPLSRTSTSQVI